MIDASTNNKRIAKNTIILYARTLFTMFVALFTSRVVLNALGVENYGIYNVVGGFVGMLSILSSSLSSAISRYITYELGRGDKSKLKRIFSTSLNIQITMAVVVVLVGEIVGIWFLNSYLNIPSIRLNAANWVFQCSLFVFAFNLLYVPYNACIIAHEKLSAFAYMSVLDVTFKLAIAYLILVSPWDRLCFYSIALLFQSVLMTSIYMLYCLRTFDECKYKLCYERGLLKELMGFAGWSFLTSSAAVLNSQGLNMLINVFFGVVVNAARGIAAQVDAVVLKFVNDFTTAINPQIIKSYAEGNMEAMYTLVCRGSKFSYFLLFFLALPIMFETDAILHWWLGIVPEHTVNFFRLTMLASMLTVLGNTGVTACMATGNIKRYTLVLTSIGFLVFPLTIIVFKLGLPAESCYMIYISIYVIVTVVRLFLMRNLVKFPIPMFVSKVICPIMIASFFALLLPLLSYHLMSPGLPRFLITSVLCVLGTTFGVIIFGLTSGERETIMKSLKNKFLCLSKH